MVLNVRRPVAALYTLPAARPYQGRKLLLLEHFLCVLKIIWPPFFRRAVGTGGLRGEGGDDVATIGPQWGDDGATMGRRWGDDGVTMGQRWGDDVVTIFRGIGVRLQ